MRCADDTSPLSPDAHSRSFGSVPLTLAERIACGSSLSLNSTRFARMCVLALTRARIGFGGVVPVHSGAEVVSLLRQFLHVCPLFADGSKGRHTALSGSVCADRRAAHADALLSCRTRCLRLSCAYVQVLSFGAIKDILDKQPRTLKQLLRCDGMTAARARKSGFGAKILKVSASPRLYASFDAQPVAAFHLAITLRIHAPHHRYRPWPRRACSPLLTRHRPKRPQRPNRPWRTSPYHQRPWILAPPHAMTHAGPFPVRIAVPALRMTKIRTVGY